MKIDRGIAEAAERLRRSSARRSPITPVRSPWPRGRPATLFHDEQDDGNGDDGGGVGYRAQSRRSSLGPLGPSPAPPANAPANADHPCSRNFRVDDPRPRGARDITRLDPTSSATAAKARARRTVNHQSSPSARRAGSLSRIPSRFTYSLIVWISAWPAPMVMVGTPCLSSQLASSPPLEKTGRFDAEGFQRLGRALHDRRILAEFERRIGRTAG